LGFLLSSVRADLVLRSDEKNRKAEETHSRLC
jgi:hypothetical protein